MMRNRHRGGAGLFDGGLFGLGDLLGLLSGVALAVSAFTAWYSGSGQGTTISVTGWHAGAPGKIVFLVGIATVVLIVLRELGIEPPAALPESLLLIAIGAVATILSLVRLIDIPEDFFFATRGVGVWISLVAAIGVILAGVLQATEDL